MLDIDYFKLVNDIYGYQVGDKVIQVLVNVIKQCVCEIDLVGCYGGEEFVVILIDVKFDDVLQVVECICCVVEVIVVEYEGQNIIFIVSLGFLEFNELFDNEM